MLQITDGVITVWLSESHASGSNQIDMAKEYAYHHNHKRENDIFTVAEIIDLRTGNTIMFAFNWHGDFEWDHLAD